MLAAGEPLNTMETAALSPIPAVEEQSKRRTNYSKNFVTLGVNLGYFEVKPHQSRSYSVATSAEAGFLSIMLSRISCLT